jgi:hypothetical protein
MSLPVKFGGVHYYRIAGRYIFAGDLFIARGMLYFFPEVDLAEQRSEINENLPHQLALLGLVVVYLAQHLKSYSSRNGLSDKGVSDEHFQSKAGAYIAQLKEERSRRGFAETLPLPTCVAANEISNLKLGLTGKVSFAAQSDDHDFNIGLRRKRLLRDALWEAGFIKP